MAREFPTRDTTLLSLRVTAAIPVIATALAFGICTAGIHHAVESVLDAVVSTATAVEEQSAVTSTISANMKTASSSVASINERLGDILRLVEAANSSARDGKSTLNHAISA